MISFKLTCSTCGANQSFVTRAVLIQEAKAHPKGHQVKISGFDPHMSNTEMHNYLQELLKEIKN